MMQQYKDLMNAVDIEIQEEDKRWAKRYNGKVTAIRITVLAMAAAMLIWTGASVVLAFVQVNLPVWEGVVIIPLILLILGRIYIIKNNRQMLMLLLQDCNPQKMLSRYMALLAYAKKKYAWKMHFYQICLALSHERRYDDMKKILSLFPKYCRDDIGRFFYEYLLTKIAYSEKNEEEMQKHCGYLREYEQQHGIPKRQRALYEDAMQSPVLFQIEKDKDYARGYEIYREHETRAPYMLQKVVANYKMYQMAKGMGDEDAAEEHRRFVLEYGGTSCLKRELEEE